MDPPAKIHIHTRETYKKDLNLLTEKLDFRKLPIYKLIYFAEEYPHLREIIKNHLSQRMKSTNTISVLSKPTLYENIENPFVGMKPNDGYALLAYGSPYVEEIDINIKTSNNRPPNDETLPITYLYLGTDEVIVNDLTISKILATIAKHVQKVAKLNMTLCYKPFLAKSVAALFSECNYVTRVSLVNTYATPEVLRYISPSTKYLLFKEVHFDSFMLVHHLYNLSSLTIELEYEQLCFLLMDLGEHCPYIDELFFKYRYKTSDTHSESKMMKTFDFNPSLFTPMRNLRKVELENFLITGDANLIEIFTSSFSEVEQLTFRTTIFCTRHLLSFLRTLQSLDMLDFFTCRMQHTTKISPVLSVREVLFDSCQKMSDQLLISLIEASPEISLIEVNRQDFNFNVIGALVEAGIKRKKKVHFKSAAYLANFILVVEEIGYDYTDDSDDLSDQNDRITFVFENDSQRNYLREVSAFIEKQYHKVVTKKFVVSTSEEQNTEVSME